MRIVTTLFLTLVLAGPCAAQMSPDAQRSVNAVVIGAAGRNYATAEICGQSPSALARIKSYTRAKYGAGSDFDAQFAEGVAAGHKMHESAVQLFADRPDHGASIFADQCQKSRANAVIYSGGRP